MNSKLMSTKDHLHTKGPQRFWENTIFEQNQESVFNEGYLTHEGSSDQTIKNTWMPLKQKMKIHDWRGLETLNLFFSRCHTLTSKGLENLFKSIAPTSTNIKKLILKFYCCHAFDSKGLELLGYCIRKYLPNLKDLTIYLTEAHAITDLGVQIFLKNLTNCSKKLESLSLNFAHCRLLTTESSKLLSLYISRYLKQLTHLSLKVNFLNANGNLTDEQINFLGKRISNNLNALQHLSLNLSYNGHITDFGVKQITDSICRKLTDLKSFELTVPIRFTEESFQYITTKIPQHLKGLQALLLDFQGCRTLSNKNLETLGKSLLDLTNLKRLTLELKDCPDLGKEGLSILPKEKQLPLNSLCLNMSQCTNLTPENLTDFVSQIDTSLRNLKEISLFFRSCLKITDYTVLKVGTHLAKCQNLQSVHLDFSGCKNLTDKSMKLFHSSTDNFSQSLKTLRLHFLNCTITNDGIKALGKSLKSFPNLQRLETWFDRSNLISDKGFEPFVLNICKNLRKLKELVLSFNFCLISNDGIKILEDAICRDQTQLRRLECHFALCKNIQPALRTGLETNLKAKLLSLEKLTLDFVNF